MVILIFIIGFLLPTPAYFNDAFAGHVQNLGGSLWTYLSSFGVVAYPVYLMLFILPIFLILSVLWSKFKPGLGKKFIFLRLLYGFLASTVVFILFVLIAISQFHFTQ